MKLLDFSPTLLSPATGARRFAGKSAKLGLGSRNMKHMTIGIRRSVEGYQVTIHKAILLSHEFTKEGGLHYLALMNINTS